MVWLFLASLFAVSLFAGFTAQLLGIDGPVAALIYGAGVGAVFASIWSIITRSVN